MTLRFIPIGLAVWIGVVCNATKPLAADRRPAAPSRSSYYRGAYVPPVALVAGMKRGHRPVALLTTPALYVAPRYVMPGFLAPWGSIPPGFYAASYPLALGDGNAEPHRLARPTAEAGPHTGLETIPLVEPSQVPISPPPGTGPYPADATGTVNPELIPTPQPVDPVR